MTEQRAGFLGLATNLAAMQAPPGALLEAENVVLRRPQSLEPRDGVTVESSMNGTEAWGFGYNGKDIFSRYAAGSFSYRSTAGDTYQFNDYFESSSNIDPQPMRRDVLTVAQSRGNAYVPTDFGVVKLVNGTGGSGAFKPAGIPLLGEVQVFNGNGTTAGTVWLATNNSVSYRIALVQTDANGVTRTSIPTGAVTFTNLLGATCAPFVYVYVRGTAETDGLVTSVEIYRTRSFAAGVAVDDEMQLVGTVPIAPGSSSVVFTDRSAESARGKTLYTSPSRGGIAAMNEPPPAAACVAAFKGSLFFANYRGPRRLRASYAYTGGFGSSAATGSATGIGRRDATANFTSGSVTVTAVSNVTGWKKGMVLNSGSVFGGTWITNIVGTTITLNQGAAATNVGAAVSAYDAIKLGSTWYTVEDLPATLFFNGASWLAYYVTPPEGGSALTVIIEKILRYSTAQTVQATHGDEYTPPLPDYDGTPLAVDQDTYPGGLRWSKKDEPEHVRPDAYAFVGDAKKALLGLVPTRDALFILKEDGVFRLTGDGATEGAAAPWRIDPYDPTLFCALPNSVRPLNERAFFLSNKGVVSFSDAGSEIISLPINDLVKPVIDTVLSGWRSTGLYELSGLVGSFAGVFERENEYTIMRSSTDDPLVWNQNTGTWTTWKYTSAAGESLSYKALFHFERAGRLVYVLGSASYKTVLSTDSLLGVLTMRPGRFDRETLVTVSGYNPTNSVVTLSAPRYVLKDDILQDNAGVLWRCTADALNSSTFFVAAQTGVAFTTGANCVLYRSLRCKATPHIFSTPPNTGKKWRSLIAAFERFDGPVVLRYAYNSNVTPRAATAWDENDAVLQLTSGRASYPQGYSYDGIVPNAQAMAWALKASVRWAMSHGEARLEGIYADSVMLEAHGKNQRAP